MEIKSIIKQEIKIDNDKILKYICQIKSKFIKYIINLYFLLCFT